MLLSALHHIGDVRDFVEGRNERAGSHAAASSVGDVRRKNAGICSECITRPATAKHSPTPIMVEFDRRGPRRECSHYGRRIFTQIAQYQAFTGRFPSCDLVS